MTNRVETFCSTESFLHCKTYLLANNVIYKAKRLPAVGQYLRIQLFQEDFGCHVNLQVRSDADCSLISEQNFDIVDYASYKEFKVEIVKVFKDMKTKAETSLESQWSHVNMMIFSLVLWSCLFFRILVKSRKCNLWIIFEIYKVLDTVMFKTTLFFSFYLGNFGILVVRWICPLPLELNMKWR